MDIGTLWIIKVSFFLCRRYRCWHWGNLDLVWWDNMVLWKLVDQQCWSCSAIWSRSSKLSPTQVKSEIIFWSAIGHLPPVISFSIVKMKKLLYSYSDGWMHSGMISNVLALGIIMCAKNDLYTNLTFWNKPYIYSLNLFLIILNWYLNWEKLQFHDNMP